MSASPDSIPKNSEQSKQGNQKSSYAYGGADLNDIAKETNILENEEKQDLLETVLQKVLI